MSTREKLIQALAGRLAYRCLNRAVSAAVKDPRSKRSFGAEVLAP